MLGRHVICDGGGSYEFEGRAISIDHDKKSPMVLCLKFHMPMMTERMYTLKS